MLEIILTMHLLTFIQLIVIGLGAVIWGIALVRRRLPFTDGFRSIVYATAATGLWQAVLGSILFFLMGCRPNNILHLVYGGIGLLGIPIAFTYASEELNRRDILILAFAAFAIVAAAIRAFGTGIGGSCVA